MKHPVVELIRARAESGSQPLRRKDGQKLGLAIEGGAMRGVVSAGMVSGLEKWGLLPVFDAIYGASAGAFNGAYFLANQAGMGTTIYYENLNGKAFIDLRRILLGQPIVNLQYLFDRVITRDKILEVPKVLDSPIPLNILASSIKELKTRVFSRFASREDLFGALHASARMPFLAGPPLEWKGELFFDAGFFQGIPIHAALEDGCTHVLVLLTRPWGSRKGGPHLLDRWIFSPRLENLRAGLGRFYLEMSHRYNQTLAFIGEAEKNFRKPPFIRSVSLPEGFPEVGRMEKRKDRLIQAAEMGRQRIDALLGEE
jgi:predicted patatin/cPLA2 family phospholipase